MKHQLNNYEDFLIYSQKEYPNLFKFVPLNAEKSCNASDHTNVTVGEWNTPYVKAKQILNNLTMLAPMKGVGIHTAPNVAIIDIDSIVNPDGTTTKLNDEQKNWFIKNSNTLAQKTNGGVHLFFKNDMNLNTASVGRNFEIKGVKFQYDIRGLGKAYVGIKELENSFILQPMKDISTVEKNFNIVAKENIVRKEYSVDEEKLKPFFQDLHYEETQEELKKLYTISNIRDNMNLQQIIDTNSAEGLRHPTFTQILLRGATYGINFNVMQDVILDINATLSEPLNEKRLKSVFAVTPYIKNAYANYIKKQENNNLLPNLRCKVTEIENTEWYTILKAHTYKIVNGKREYINYRIKTKNTDAKEGDIIDAKVSSINFQTQYEKNGETIKIKKPRFEVSALNAFTSQPELKNNFNLTVNGIVKKIDTTKEDYNIILLESNSKQIYLKGDKNYNVNVGDEINVNVMEFQAIESKGSYRSYATIITKEINQQKNHTNNTIKIESNEKLTENDVVETNSNTIKTNEAQNISNTQINEESMTNIDMNEPFIPLNEPPQDIGNDFPPEYLYNDDINVPNYNYGVEEQENINNSDEIIAPNNSTKIDSKNQKKTARRENDCVNLRIKIAYIKFESNYMKIKGYSKYNDNMTNYHVILPINRDIKVGDITDINIQNLTYENTYLDEGIIKNKKGNFSATGDKITKVTPQTPKRMFGASVSGIIVNDSNFNIKLTSDVAIKTNNHENDISLKSDVIKQSPITNKRVTLPIVSYNREQNYAKIHKRVTMHNFTHFEHIENSTIRR